MSATVAHASGSEGCVFLPWLLLLLSLHSVPLLLSFPCNSVANASVYSPTVVNASCVGRKCK